MVAYLERTDGNDDYHEIVDFLTTIPIHYALTVSPTIYASYIDQFWNTTHSQTINDVKQIHATFDGKTIVISESSMRSDLYFNNEDGITCLTNDTIFENLALMGYESDSDKLTFQKALFSPSMENKSLLLNHHHPKNTQTPRQALQEDTQLPHTSVPIPNVVDEAVFKEWDDRVVRATTTTASLDAAQARGDRPKCQEAMEGVIGQTRIKKLERKAKSSIPPPKRRLYKQVDSSDDSLGEENASKQERNDSNKTEEFNLSDKGSGRTKVFDDTTAAEKDVNAAEPVSTASDAITAASVIPDIDTTGPSNVSDAGPSTSTAGDIFKDEMMTISDTLVAIRSTRPRTTSIVIRDVEEEPRRATPVPIVQSQDKGKGKMVE
ncbi:hypothetical protein Tco_1072979 [Tanacetum coccineum]